MLIRMNQSLILKATVITLLVASTAAAIAWAARPHYSGIRSGHADENYLDSQKCLTCHPGHYGSWARTFHSRMTQEASAKSVLGDFEHDNTYEFLGIRARMEKRSGQYLMSLAFPDGHQQTFNIERTVGSRRIQQYITCQNGQRTRLPLAYDLVNHRWMSLNGSFFNPDSQNYFQHQSTWDGNCVFCHNVKAQPNMSPQTRQYSTDVAELGIACGACHAQGAKHAEAAGSPWTRTLWRSGIARDTQIVQPAHLTSERSMMVCGHCHGQRVPEPIDRIQQIMTHGDPFNAGDDLSQYFRPVTRETKVGDYSFANRFWKNGSPRLTAYEYQGILRSQCYQKGKTGARINCLTCHSMHEGDPKGQITPENRTNQPCLSCHEEFSTADALAKHTRHRADGIGSQCYNCHMPRVVYGIMSFHPSHDITVPDPSLTIKADVPNACNLCHLDKSVNWTIRESKRLWPNWFEGTTLSSDERFDQPEGLRDLFAGDALTRAMAADALGGGGPMKIASQLDRTPDADVGRPIKLDAAWTLPFLIEACADDYPIVRFFALQGIASQEPRLGKPDYLAPSSGPRHLSEQLWQDLMALRQNVSPTLRQQVTDLSQTLRKQRVNVDLEVGE